jgi:hypothetical protein
MLEVKEQNGTVDWGHHIIRYAVFRYNIMKNLVNKRCVYDRDQIVTITRRIAHIKWKRVDSVQKYYAQLDDIRKKKGKNICYQPDWFPLLCFRDERYSPYFEFTEALDKIIEKIKTKIDNLPRKVLPEFCPIECVVFLYVFETYQLQRFSEIDQMDVYRILYCYGNCGQEGEDHKCGCLCSELFPKKISQIEPYPEICMSIKKHYELLQLTSHICEKYFERLENEYGGETFKYNICHNSFLFSYGENFKISAPNLFVANSEKYVLYFMIKPSCNKLNLDEILIDAKLTLFILENTCGEDNIERFRGKSVIACIFTLDKNEPIFISFNLENDIYEIRTVIKKCLIYKYSAFHELIYDFYEHHLERGGLLRAKRSLEKYKKAPKYIEEYINSIKSRKEKNEFLEGIGKMLQGRVDDYVIDIDHENIDNVDTDLVEFMDERLGKRVTNMILSFFTIEFPTDD